MTVVCPEFLPKKTESVLIWLNLIIRKEILICLEIDLLHTVYKAVKHAFIIRYRPSYSNLI